MSYTLKRPRVDESIPLTLLDSLVTEEELRAQLKSTYSSNYRSGSSLSSTKNARVGNFWKCVNAVTGQGEWAPLPSSSSGGGSSDTAQLEADVAALKTKTSVYTATPQSSGDTWVDFGTKNVVFVPGLIVDKTLRFYENPVLQNRDDASDRKTIPLDKITDLSGMAQFQLNEHSTSITGLSGEITVLEEQVAVLNTAMFGAGGAFVALTGLVIDLEVKTASLSKGTNAEFQVSELVVCEKGISSKDNITFTSSEKGLTFQDGSKLTSVSTLNGLPGRVGTLETTVNTTQASSISLLQQKTAPITIGPGSQMAISHEIIANAGLAVYRGDVLIQTDGKGLWFPDGSILRSALYLEGITSSVQTQLDTLTGSLSALAPYLADTVGETKRASDFSDVTLTTGTTHNVATISLPVGVWQVNGQIIVKMNKSSSGVKQILGGLSSVSATVGTASAIIHLNNTTQATGNQWSLNFSRVVKVLTAASPTTFYAIVQAVFGTTNAMGVNHSASYLEAVRFNNDPT